MLGYPGSGKSYFAGQLAKEINAIRFNSDVMRHYLFRDPIDHHGRSDHKLVTSAINGAVASVLQAGHSVIYDLNNNFIEDRQNYARIAEQYDTQCIIVWIKTPLDLAVERGALRPASQEHITVDRAWVERIAAEIEEPMPIELRIEIDGTVDFKAQYSSFCEQKKKFDL